MHIENYYKYDEIKQYFDEWIEDHDSEYIRENLDDLHHYVFNEDYYIIGNYEAKKWLSDEVFNIIDIIKEYENDNFGEVHTDFSQPERVVNMYVYIVGETITYNYINSLEDKSA